MTPGTRQQKPAARRASRREGPLGPQRAAWAETCRPGVLLLSVLALAPLDPVLSAPMPTSVRASPLPGATEVAGARWRLIPAFEDRRQALLENALRQQQQRTAVPSELAGLAQCADSAPDALPTRIPPANPFASAAKDISPPSAEAKGSWMFGISCAGGITLFFTAGVGMWTKWRKRKAGDLKPELERRPDGGGGRDPAGADQSTGPRPSTPVGVSLSPPTAAVVRYSPDGSGEIVISDMPQLGSDDIAVADVPRQNAPARRAGSGGAAAPALKRKLSTRIGDMVSRTLSARADDPSRRLSFLQNDTTAQRSATLPGKRSWFSFFDRGSHHPRESQLSRDLPTFESWEHPPFPRLSRLPDDLRRMTEEIGGSLSVHREVIERIAAGGAAPQSGVVSPDAPAQSRESAADADESHGYEPRDYSLSVLGAVLYLNQLDGQDAKSKSSVGRYFVHPGEAALSDEFDYLCSFIAALNSPRESDPLRDTAASVLSVEIRSPVGEDSPLDHPPLPAAADPTASAGTPDSFATPHAGLAASQQPSPMFVLAAPPPLQQTKRYRRSSMAASVSTVRVSTDRRDPRSPQRGESVDEVGLLQVLDEGRGRQKSSTTTLCDATDAKHPEAAESNQGARERKGDYKGAGGLLQREPAKYAPATGLRPRRSIVIKLMRHSPAAASVAPNPPGQVTTPVPEAVVQPAPAGQPTKETAAARHMHIQLPPMLLPSLMQCDDDSVSPLDKLSNLRWAVRRDLSRRRTTAGVGPGAGAGLAPSAEDGPSAEGEGNPEETEMLAREADGEAEAGRRSVESFVEWNPAEDVSAIFGTQAGFLMRRTSEGSAATHATRSSD